MFYIISSNNRVLFRSKNKTTMDNKAEFMNTYGFGNKVTVSDTKPVVAKETNINVAVLSYNDPIESF